VNQTVFKVENGQKKYPIEGSISLKEEIREKKQ
jgi:hypothetical protein